MINLEMIELSELNTILDEHSILLNKEYIDKYISLFNNIELKDLVVVKNIDNSYSVYDNVGNIINLIKKKGKKYMVFPIGIVCILSTTVLLTNDLIDNVDSIFDQFNYIYSMPYNERMDQFLYYINILIIDLYGLDITKSNAELSMDDYVLIDGIKEEWVLVDKDIRGEIDYDDVTYIIESWIDRDKINIRKMYSIDNMKDDVFKVSIYDIINKGFDDFEQKRITGF